MTAPPLDPTQARELLSRSRHFVQFGLARATTPLGNSVIDTFQRRVGIHSPYLDLIRKADVDAIGSASAGSPLVSTPLLSDAFVARLRDRLVATQAGFRQVPMGVSLALVGTGTTASWAGLDSPALVSSMAFDRLQLLATALLAIVVLSKELATTAVSGAVAAIEEDLLIATARAENAALLSSEDAIAELRPAGLLNGLSSVGGSPAAADEADVAALVAAVRGGEPIAPVFVASRYGALHLAQQRSVDGTRLYPDVTLAGEPSLWGVPLLLDPAAEGRLILIDAAAIAYADGGVELGSSGDTALQMSNTPAAGPAQMVSMYMTNSIAIKATKWVNWQKAYDDAVAFLDLGVGSP